MTFLLAALAYLPLGFVVAACWLEAVSAFKKDPSNQPGVITVLFGGLVVILVATIVHFALPLEPMPVLAATDGAGAVASVPPEAAAPAASGPAWPATAPRWASLLGLGSLALLGGAYGLRLHFRRLEAAATAAQNDPEPPTPKHLRRLRKKANDVQLGYWFALLACALLVVFNVLGAPGFNPLGQAVAFLPLSLLGVAVWLEIVSSAKASESNQPAALTTIFAAAVTSLVAVGAAFLATPDERLESLSVAPAWKSVWGFAAFAFVSLAYLLKLRAVNQRARSAALAATMSKPGAAYSYGRKLRMQQASASPVAYGFTVATALVFLCLAHFRVLTREGELVAKIQEATSKASESIARASQSGPSTLDQFSEDEGTLGGLLAANTVTNLPSPSAEELDPPPDDAMDDTGGEEDPLADPAEGDSESMTAEATAPPDSESESSEPAPTPEVAMNESPAEATTPPPAPAPDPAAMDPTEAPPGESATLSAAETAIAVSHIQPYDNGRFFSSQVRPILASTCYECHGSEQKKGGLQLHTPEALVAGGNGGAVVVAGNPDASSLYISTTLSPDDPDIMPAKGNPLNPRQTAILRKWILDGAHLPGGQATSALLVANNAGGNWKIDQDSAKLSPPNPAVIQLLEQQGVQFRALSANSAFIKADYSHVDRSGPLAMESLAPIAANIYWLDLTRSQVADADLAHVAQMQNIRTLELNRTRISDAGLSHLAQLPNIEVLNLYGTGVSDAGLTQLAGLATLRKLYIWETQVTQAGIDTIKQAIPELDVIAGN